MAFIYIKALNIILLIVQCKAKILQAIHTLNSQPSKLTRKQIKLHALFLASYCKPTQQPEIWVTQNSTGILLRLLLMQLLRILPKHPLQKFSIPLTPLPVFAFGPAKLAQGWSREEQHQNEKKFKHSDFPPFQW